MRISGIQKTTLLDYPWKVACIIFTTGCNMRCKFCYNSNFVLPEKIRDIKDFIPEEIFFNFLQWRKWLLDGVVICWGEPTIQKDLIDFCQKIKNMWFLVKLDTNGSNPAILHQLMNKKLVDYIAMDIKFDFSEKANDLLWIKLDKIMYLKSIKYILESEIDYEFRTTLIKQYHNFDNFKTILHYIRWSKRYSLQNYRSWNTLDDRFQGKSFSYKELSDFQTLASKYVKNCIIRI